MHFVDQGFEEAHHSLQNVVVHLPLAASANRRWVKLAQLRSLGAALRVGPASASDFSLAAVHSRGSRRRQLVTLLLFPNLKRLGVPECEEYQHVDDLVLNDLSSQRTIRGHAQPREVLALEDLGSLWIQKGAPLLLLCEHGIDVVKRQ